MKYKKIITHSGAFHADEILAIVTVFLFYKKLPVERTYDFENYLEDPEVLVLDIGRKYEPGKGNFDHHQSEGLQATNIMVLDYFCTNPDIRSILLKNLYQYVSHVDRGLIIEGNDKAEFLMPSFSSIIRNMNHMEQNGFEKALELATSILNAFVAGANKIIEGRKLWSGLEFAEGYAVQQTTEKIVGWQDLAAGQEIIFLITPNLRGGYQIISRDSEKYPIEKVDEGIYKQTYRHNTGFLAVYEDLDAAINHTRKMIVKIKNNIKDK